MARRTSGNPTDEEAQEQGGGEGQENSDQTDLTEGGEGAASEGGEETTEIQQDEQSGDGQGDQTDLTEGGEEPPEEEKEDPLPESGTVRIKHNKLKNGKITLGNGKIAEFDAEGIAEIEVSQAARLLTIPNYSRA